MRKEIINNSLIDSVSSIQAEAFQRIQVNIEYAGIDKKIKVFGVISANQSEGKSTTACNLAKLYALKGIKVCIVDLDLRRPNIHRIFKIVNDFGVSDYVLGKKSKKEVIKHIDGLDIITAGLKNVFPTNILQSEALSNLINELREEYDYVIIDTPPILLVADSIIISKLCDGFINIVASGVTKKKDLKDSLEMYNQNQMKIIGIVLTRIKMKKKHYYDYSYE